MELKFLRHVWSSLMGIQLKTAISALRCGTNQYLVWKKRICTGVMSSTRVLACVIKIIIARLSISNCILSISFILFSHMFVCVFVYAVRKYCIYYNKYCHVTVISFVSMGHLHLTLLCINFTYTHVHTTRVHVRERADGTSITPFIPVF